MIGAGAAAAIALVVVGFIALSGGPVGSGVEELKGYKTASEYAAEFRQ